MNARLKRPAPVRQVGASCFSDLALRCARNLYKASNRRMPEAQALAIWLGQAASTFGLTDAAVPDYETPLRNKRGGISLRDWHKIGRALVKGDACLPPRRNVSIDRWVEKIARTLSFDPLEAKILALALQYQLDQRVRTLCDCFA